MTLLVVFIVEHPHHLVVTNGLAERRGAAEIARFFRCILLTPAVEPERKIEQRRIEMNRTMVRRHRRRLDEAAEIEWAARLRSGARKAATAEWLHADHSADDVPVHIDIADFDAVGDMRDGLVQTRMQPESQAVAGRVDIVDPNESWR